MYRLKLTFNLFVWCAESAKKNRLNHTFLPRTFRTSALVLVENIPDIKMNRAIAKVETFPGNFSHNISTYSIFTLPITFSRHDGTQLLIVELKGVIRSKIKFERHIKSSDEFFILWLNPHHFNKLHVISILSYPKFKSMRRRMRTKASSTLILVRRPNRLNKKNAKTILIYAATTWQPQPQLNRMEKKPKLPTFYLNL